jgi:hypothetical protein
MHEFAGGWRVEGAVYTNIQPIAPPAPLILSLVFSALTFHSTYFLIYKEFGVHCIYIDSYLCFQLVLPAVLFVLLVNIYL